MGSGCGTVGGADGRLQHQRTWVQIQPLAFFIKNIYLSFTVGRTNIKKKIHFPLLM